MGVGEAARGESEHRSNGGNYSPTPSPVTRGLGGTGAEGGGAGWGGEERGSVCHYPESSWLETSAAVPADFTMNG